MTDLIDAYLGHLLAADFSEATITERGGLLRRADRVLPLGLDYASEAELEAWLGQPGWARWTRYTYWEHLWTFYAWADGRYLDWNPMEGMIRPRTPESEPRPVTDDQLEIGLALPAPWGTAVALAYYDGLRCAEIARLSTADVTESWTAVLRKGGKVQLLPTHEQVWAIVVRLPPGPVVPDSHGGHYRPSTLSNAASRRLRRAGVVGVGLHGYRHSFATQLLLPVAAGGAGADIRTVQDLLGHKSVRSTQVYTRVTDPQRRAAIAGLRGPARAA